MVFSSGAGTSTDFYSELRVEDLSTDAKSIIYSYTKGILKDPVDALDLNNAKEVDQYLHSSPWRLPTLHDYEFLATESEYAAVDDLQSLLFESFHDVSAKFRSIQPVLECNGILINDSGRKNQTKCRRTTLTKQHGGGNGPATFAGGEEKMIPGSYVEFAERRNGREGFEAANADKIFESTDIKQVERKQ